MLTRHTGLHEVTCFHIKLAWTVQNLNMFTTKQVLELLAPQECDL